MTAASYQHQHHQRQHHNHNYRPLKILNRDDDCYTRFKTQIIAKRKSAVELLQETKPLYVKSEIVLDRKQELRGSLRGYHLPNEDEELTNVCLNAGTFSGQLCGSSHSISPPPVYNNASTGVLFPLPKSPRLIPPPAAFRKSTNSLQLQNKLRKLLNADSKENLTENDSSSAVANNEDVSEIDDESKFHLKNYYSNQMSSICHKSLPDLTNVRDLSTSIDSNDYANYGGYTSCSISSDGLCKKSTHTDCVSLASCKNDRLHASADCCESQNDSNFEDDTDVMNQHGDSSPPSPIKSCSSLITPPPLYCDTKELNKSRSFIARSKSDVGARTFSSLQLVEISSYDSSNLNMFFDNLGLESNEYNSLTAPRSNASSPVYFNSDSSVISTGECISGGDNPQINNHTAELPSIVERNARIIKWLCNCRKALEQIPRFTVPQSR